MTTLVQRKQLLYKVLNTQDAMNGNDFHILHVYGHNAAKVKALRRELRIIRDKLNDTEDIMWQYVEESVHWETMLNRYCLEFWVSLGVPAEDYPTLGLWVQQ